jgi:Large polyvalent protein associated domain 38
MAEQQYIQLPDNSYFPIHKGESEMDALQVAMSKYPEIFRPKVKEEEKPKADTGFFSELGAGAREGAGSALSGFGELTGLEGLRRFGEQQKIKAAETPEAEGIMGDVGRSIGSIAGRFGAPILGGIAATAALPEELAAAPILGGLASLGRVVGAAGFAGTDVPINVGEQLQAQKALGQDTNLARATAVGIGQTAINLIGGEVLSSPMRSVLGKTAAEKAAEFVPDVLAGKITASDAAKQVGGLLRNILQGTAQNAIVGGATMVGSDVLGRAGLGQDLTSPEALAGYGKELKMGAELSPIFGTLHGFGSRREAGRILTEAEQGRQARTALEAQQAELTKTQQAAQEAQEQSRLQTVEEAKKQTPEYALDIGQKYQDALDTYKRMKEALVKPNKDADPATKAQYVDDRKAIDEHFKNVVMPLVPEFNRTRALREQTIKAQQNAAKLAEEKRLQDIETAGAKEQPTANLAYYESPQKTLPGIQGVEQPEFIKQVDPNELNAHKANLAQTIARLERIRDEHQQRENDIVASGDPYAFAQFSKEYDAVNNAHKKASDELKALGGYNPNEPHPTTVAQKVYNKAVAKWQSASKAGTPGYDPEKARREFENVKVAQQNLENTINRHGLAPTQEQMEFDYGPEDKTTFSESKAASSARLYKPGSPEAEAEEQAFIEEARRRDEEDIARANQEREDIPRKKEALAKEIADMEAARIDPQRAEQQNLFPNEPGVDEITGFTNLVNPNKLPQKVRPEDRLYRQLERAFAEDPNNWLPEQRRLLERISDNLPAIEAKPENMEAVSDWLYHIDHNRSLEKLKTPEGQPRYVKREDFRAKDLTKMLDSMDRGKLSETDEGKTAVQGELNLGFAKEAKGKIFNTPQEFQNYLAGDALNDMRRSMGITKQTMSRMARRVAPLQAKASQILEQVEALRKRFKQLESTKGAETAEANKMLAAANARQKEMIDRLDNELGDLQIAYLQAQQDFEFAVKTSLDISKNFAANQYSDLAKKVVDAKKEFLELLKRPITSTLNKSAAATRAETNNNIAKLREAHNKVISATRELRDFEDNMKKDPTGFLDKDLNFQLQMQDELALRGNLIYNLTAAKFDLDMAAEKQGRSLKNKAEAKVIKGEIETAEQIKGEVEKVNAERDAEMKSIKAQITALNDKRKEIERVTEEALGTVKKGRAETKFVLPKEKTSIEKQNETGRLRAEEESRLENLEKIPGERVSFEPRRELMERLKVAPQDLEALDDNIEDANIIYKQVEGNLNKFKKELAATPNTPENKEKIESLKNGIKQSEKDLENLKEVKEKFQTELENKREKLDKYTKQFSTDPEMSSEAFKAVNERIDKVVKNIAKTTKSANEKNISPQLRQSRLRDLRRYQQELKDLQAISDTERGIERTPVKREEELKLIQEVKDAQADIYKHGDTPENKAALREARDELDRFRKISTAVVEPGERLPSRIIGPVVRPVVTAGNIRTGEAATAGQRKLPTRQQAIQAGQKRGVTAKQAIREGNKVSKTSASTATENFLQKYDRLSEYKEKNDQRLLQAEMDNDVAKIAEYEKVGRQIDKELEKAEAELDKHMPTGLFRTSVKTGAGMKSETIKRLVDRMTAGWEKMPEVEIVAAEKDLPEAIQAQMAEAGKTGKIPGLYDPSTKKVYLVAENLHDTEDVVATVLHEVAGHHGLREMLGDTYAKTMNALYNGNEALRKTVDERMLAEPKLSREIAVEETLADMAEKAPFASQRSMNMLRRIGMAIKNFFSKLFGRKLNFTDDEVQQIVANARRYVKKGIGGAGGETGFRHFLYRTAPEYGVPNALTDFTKKIVAQPKSLKERFWGEHGWLQAEMNNVDMRAGIREALKLGAKATDDNRSYEQAMYNIEKADQKSSFTRSVLLNGAPQMYTDEKGFHGVKAAGGVNYMDIMKATSAIPNGNAKGKIDQASAYLIAQRAANKGLPKLDIGELGVKQEDLDNVMKAVDADPQLKKAMENVRSVYNKYNENLINWLASTGAIPKTLAKDLLAEGDYVPFYRVKPNGEADLVFSDKVHINIGDIRRQPYLQELKGGETKIMSIDEAIPRNTQLIVDKGLSNLAARGVAYALQSFAKEQMPIHSGYGPADPNVIRFNQEPNPTIKNDDGRRWLKVNTDGTVLSGVPTDLVVKSLEGSHLALPTFLKLGGMAGDLLRSGVTRTPLYALHQLLKDPMSMAFTGGLDYNPLKAVYKAGKEFVAMNIGDNKNAAKLIEKGLIQSGIFTGDQSELSKFALQLASGKDQNAIDRLFAAADRVAMRADSATRVLVYENAIKNGLSEVQADRAVMESMNYYKKGLSPTLQYANRLIPFFNSQIQGLNVLYKAARGQMPYNEQLKIQEKFMNNAMVLMGAGLIYGMAMQDDEYYKNAKPKDRYTNFFMHLPFVNEPIKLPIPYEAGYFFSASVAAVDAIMGSVDTKQQVKALRDMFLSSVPGYTSMFTPELVKPIAEVWTNKDFYTGEPIESERMSRKTVDERYTQTTSELAKAFSKALPMLSPIQIEHIVKGYLGSLPLAAANVTNSLFTKGTTGEAPEARASDMPVVGGLFQRKYGGAESDVVYGLAKEATAAADTYRSMLKEGRIEDAKEFLENNRAQIFAGKAGRRYENVMGSLRTQQDVIINNKKLSDVEKRAKIDSLDALKQKETDLFMKAIRDAETRGKTKPQLVPA